MVYLRSRGPFVLRGGMKDGVDFGGGEDESTVQE